MKIDRIEINYKLKAVAIKIYQKGKKNGN